MPPDGRHNLQKVSRALRHVADLGAPAAVAERPGEGVAAPAPADPLVGAVPHPERRKLDRNLVARILYLAEALERRTRGKGQHGGLC